ncbi:MAG: putative quinol monooxygenase [Pseudomonadales bacterium]
MKKVVLEVHIEVPKEDLAALLVELPNHLSVTKNEAGCLEFQVKQRVSRPCVFDVYEEFENKDAFDLHQSRVRESKWGEINLRATRHYQVNQIDT